MTVTVLDRASASDAAPILAAIHASAFAETGARAWSADEIHALIERPTATVFIAENGFLVIDVVASEAEILTFAVTRAAQRRGTGRALLDFALKWMGKNAVSRCFLEVADYNVTAISLYTAFQFRGISRRPAYFRRRSGVVDALVMERLLAG